MTDPKPTYASGDEDRARHDLARRELRSHTRGVLRLDETVRDLRFIIDGRNGSMVIPAHHDAADAHESVLHLPDDGFDASAVCLLSLEPIADEFDESLDRHLAYHGEVRAPGWCRATIESVRLAHAGVIDGASLTLTNPLRADEPALVRELNTDRSRLRRATALLLAIEPIEALAVGVDDLGFDVRSKHGVLRVAFPAPVSDAAEARRVIAALLEGAA